MLTSSVRPRQSSEKLYQLLESFIGGVTSVYGPSMSVRLMVGYIYPKRQGSNTSMLKSEH